jgi:hypothetical protein
MSNNKFSQFSSDEEEAQLCELDEEFYSEETFGDLLEDDDLLEFAGTFFGSGGFDKYLNLPITESLIQVFLSSYYLFLEETNTPDELLEEDLPAAPVGGGRAPAPAPAKSCTFFQQGRCNKGASCQFSHDAPASAPAPAPAPAASAASAPAKSCTFFQQGRCNKGVSCRFSHQA